MDNYEIAKQRACQYFLTFQQEKLIQQWALLADDACITVTFFAKQYAICRKTGNITRLWDNQPAGFNETLSIFDLLCHQPEHSCVSGDYAPVNSLHKAPKTGGVSTDFNSKRAQFFQNHLENFRKACVDFGGEEVPMGDVGYRFCIFGELSVILKFYYGDMDFSPSITLLWDKNLLQFVHYETVFYMAGFLLSSLTEKVKEMSEK